ncbi:unnamed protein product [Paramecium sonneborni]|uniref:Transmembrane protein n=1 Tax=Paramecium sonneborni TaxID=65129 RepID=A0A8S1JYE4_9CILI|nr:unnamed protein product [Paramecium sonneborni]
MFEDKYLETLQQQLLLSKVVPIILSPKNILKSLLAAENMLDQEHLYQSICKKQELIINNLNEENADVILCICKFIKIEFDKQKEGRRDEIKQGVLKQIEIECINWPQYKNPRWPEYLEYFNGISIKLINHTYMLIEQILIDLTTKQFICEEFHQYMTDKLEHCMVVLSMEMSDFARVINNEIFYLELKKYFNTIIQNVHLYINRTSLFCNTQMEYLNETLTKYHTLANIRTYQILQIETSQYIIDQCHQSLNEMKFHRVEFEIFDKDLVKQIIRYFYEYSPLSLGLYELSTLTKSFQDAIQMYYILDDQYFLTADLDTKLFAQDEECIKYKIWLDEKRKKQSQLGNQPVIKGSVGAGLGCLIVDSVDPKIPWDEKLKRAGISSIATGLVGAAMRIPVVGVILSQALLFYAIRIQANNKVVDKGEKIKNIAHLGFQSSFGIGTVIAGQILIPIPVLGALIGGTVGGVFMGLYTKFIIPKTKPSIKLMINDLMTRQYADGLFQYEDQVLKIMKINQQHYFGLKPDHLNECQWLTILMVYMVNEIHYLSNVQGLEKINELQQQIEKKPKDETKLIKQIKEVETELEQQEIINVKMERSRYYIQEQEINTLQIVDKIGEFINGMIANFRL